MVTCTIKGRTGLHIFLSVPKEEEEATDALLANHQSFMSATHSIGEDGDKPRITEYHWSKGQELTEAMDPSKGETGNLLYVMSETYPDPTDIAAHMEVAGTKFSMMDKLMGHVGSHAKHVDIGSEVVVCLTDDKSECCNVKVGDTTLNMVLNVPEAREAEVDAMWKEHEVFMRKTHTFDSSATDDKAAVRLTSYVVCKGKQQNDPMDPEKGFTGNVSYIMTETYVAPEGIGAHMEVANKEWPEGLAKLVACNNEFGAFTNMGSAKVCRTMAA